MPIRDDFTEKEAEAVVEAFKRGVFGLKSYVDFADLVMAHIRQTTKIRAGSASTQTRAHTGTSVLQAGSATMSGSGSIVQAQNNPPVWQTVPNITFTQGVAATFSVAGLVSDPENDPITITKNAAALPSGVTFDSANKRFSYDGVGGVGTSSGHVLSADDGVSDTIVQFGLNSTSTGTAKPFCFLHSFKRGNVPLGRSIVASISDFQATILNRWPDGSVKHALIAGHLDLTANVTRYIDLKSGTSGGGSALTEAQLIATGIGSDTFQLGSLGTVQLSNVLGRLSSGKGSAGLIRTRIAGPEMSEFHYYSPVGTDNHLSLFFYIRYFKNGAVEIEVSTENGWLKVASPSAKAYTSTTFTINGTNRTSGIASLNHRSQTKWGAVYWRGTDPAVRPVHDMAYYRASGVVPKYLYTSPSAGALTGFTSTNNPFQLGDYEADLGSTGDFPGLGLLPKWEALHCTSASSSTYIATIYNSYGLGRYSLVYRDESTMGMPLLANHPQMVYEASGWFSSDKTPVISGGANATWDLAHHPSAGYLAYLLTGRWSYLETLQFSVYYALYYQNPATRQNGTGILSTSTSALQTRGAAWTFRGLAQALCVTPDGDPVQTDLATIFANNMAFYASNYVNSVNNLGLVLQLENYTNGQGFTTWAPWQDDFFTQALGWAQYMGLPISTTAQANLDAFLQWKGKAPAGRAGTVGSTEYCYRSSNQYNLRVADSESFGSIANYNAAVYANWGVMYQRNIGTNSDCQANADILGAMGTAAYVMNMFPALSVAVDNGVPGALAGYNRIIGAPNFIALTTAGSGFHNDPRYAIGPRSV